MNQVQWELHESKLTTIVQLLVGGTYRKLVKLVLAAWSCMVVQIVDISYIVLSPGQGKDLSNRYTM